MHLPGENSRSQEEAHPVSNLGWKLHEKFPYTNAAAMPLAAYAPLWKTVPVLKEI